jgi:hypothetical protein
MSLSATSDLNLLNLSTSASLGADLITRDGFSSTIVGYLAGTSIRKSQNVVAGFYALAKAKDIARTVAIGYYIGAELVGEDNVLIGTKVNQNVVSSYRNTLIGANVCMWGRGDQNIILGYNHNTSNSDYASNCIGIGVGSMTSGCNNIVMGFGASVGSKGSIVLGNFSSNSSPNNIILGSGIVNTGSNCLIIKNNHAGLWTNSNDNYININDVLISEVTGAGEKMVTLSNDIIRFQSGTTSMTLSNQFFVLGGGVSSEISLGDVITLAGAYSQLTLNKDVVISGSNSTFTLTENGQLTYLGKESSAMIGSSNISFVGSNIGLLLSPSNISLYGSNATALSIGSSNAQISMDPAYVSIVGKSVSIASSNGEFLFTPTGMSYSNTKATYMSLSGSNTSLNITPQAISLISSNAASMILSLSNTNLSMSSSNIELVGKTADSLSLKTSNVEFTLTNSNVLLSGPAVSTMTLTGSNTTVAINESNISLRCQNGLLQFQPNLIEIRNSNIFFNSTPLNVNLVASNASRIVLTGCNLQYVITQTSNSLVASNMRSYAFSGSNMEMSFTPDTISMIASNASYSFIGSNAWFIMNQVGGTTLYNSNSTNIRNSKVTVLLDDNITLSNGTSSVIVTSSNVYIKPDLLVESNLAIRSNLMVTGSIMGSSTATFCNDVIVGRDLIANRNTTLCNNLLVLGPTTLSNVTNAYRTMNVYDTFTAHSNASFQSNVYVGGVSTFQSNVVVYGNSSFCNNVYIANAIVSGSLALSGPLSLSNIDVLGVATFCNPIIAKSNLTVLGRSTLCNTSFLSGVTFCNTANFYSPPTFWNGANMRGPTVFFDQVTFCNLDFLNGLNIGNNSNISYSNAYYTNVTVCNLTVTNRTTFGNNTYVDGVINIGAPGSYLAYSNITNSNVNEFFGAAVVDEDLYVGGRIFCNGFTFTANNPVASNVRTLTVSEEFYSLSNATFCNNAHFTGATTFDSLTVTGMASFSNTIVRGSLIMGSPGDYIAYSNVTNSNVNEFLGAAVIDEDLYVGGRIFCNGFSMASAISELTSSINLFSNINLLQVGETTPRWIIGLENVLPPTSDLIFKSKNNTTVTFTDNFTTETLNFTAKHRCSTEESIDMFNISEYVGKIVIANGTYINLNEESKIEIDEAIPRIELASKKKDPRVFGVIAGLEDPGNQRSYKLGNLKFEHEKKDNSAIKVIINSLGEGAIWVCNADGPLKNGDLITSSHIPGLGTKQNSQSIMSYTVAKITCDCDFKVLGGIMDVQEFTHNGREYKRAFVGCVYK